MPSFQPKVLFIGNSNASNIYTVTNVANNYTIIKNINICNIDTATARSVSINILPPATSAAANNIYISNVLVPPNDILQIDSTFVIQAGYSIYITHGGNITTTISGVEYS
jgi:hypothetical protein